MFKSTAVKKGFLYLAALLLLLGRGGLSAHAAEGDPAAEEAYGGELPEEAEDLGEAEAYEAYVGAVSGLKAACTGNQRVRLTWNPAWNANFYIVLRMKEGGNCRQIGYTAVCSFTDASADSMGFNYYWVVPYSISKSTGAKDAGPLSQYVYACGRWVDQVRNLKASPGSGGTKLSWSAASGANAYVILSRTGSPEAPYNPAVTVTGTSYTDTASAEGQVTYYWVHGIYKRYGSAIAAGPTSSFAWAYRENAGKAFTEAEAEAALKKHFIKEHFEGRMSYQEYRYLNFTTYAGSRRMKFEAILPLGEGAIPFASGEVDLLTGEAYINADWDLLYDMFNIYIPGDYSYYVNLNQYR